MTRKNISSQWEFGDLFNKPAEPETEGSPKPDRKARKTTKPSSDVAQSTAKVPTEPAMPAQRSVLSVSKFTDKIKTALESQFGEVWLTGEVSNLRVQSSGHRYFSLKDESAQIACVLFRGQPGIDRELIDDGRKLILRGDISVYSPQGRYQIIVREVELEGIGELQRKFEALKKKLQSEGLFDSERKRPLPDYIQRIGLVTSPSGAAIRDVLHVISRRYPALEIVLVPVRVQGAQAAGEIASALALLNQFHNEDCREGRSGLDLILATRGGGSLEDLWPFNEEIVARAMFESTLPVVSAVGHEIDFTISDFVADVRAATPSAAAEIVTEGMFATRQTITQLRSRMERSVASLIEEAREEITRLGSRLVRQHPRRRIEAAMQRLDELSITAQRQISRSIREKAQLLAVVEQRMLRWSPDQVIAKHSRSLSQLAATLNASANQKLNSFRNRLVAAAGQLRLLSPQNTLERGYSITLNAETGRVIRKKSDAENGTRLQTRVSDGDVKSVVEDRD